MVDSHNNRGTKRDIDVDVQFWPTSQQLVDSIKWNKFTEDRKDASGNARAPGNATVNEITRHVSSQQSLKNFLIHSIGL